MFTALALTVMLLAPPPVPAQTGHITNPVARLTILDKITGRIQGFDVYMGETVRYGALRLRIEACYTRPATETPVTMAFLRVDELPASENDFEKVFAGWMFASSPALNAMEHPVYDLWLNACAQDSLVPEPGTSGARQLPQINGLRNIRAETPGMFAPEIDMLAGDAPVLPIGAILPRARQPQQAR